MDICILPLAGMTPRFNKLATRVRQRFGAHHVTLLQGNVQETHKFTSSPVLIVWIEKSLSSDYWQQHPFEIGTIQTALDQKKLIIPLIESDVSMPTAGSIPETIAAFAFRQAITVKDSLYMAVAKINTTIIAQFDFNYALVVWFTSLFASIVALVLLFAQSTNVMPFFQTLLPNNGMTSRAVGTPDFMLRALLASPDLPGILFKAVIPLIFFAIFMIFTFIRSRWWELLLISCIGLLFINYSVALLLSDLYSFWVSSVYSGTNVLSASLFGTLPMYQKNSWLLILLFGLGSVLIVFALIRYFRQALRTVRDQNLVYFTAANGQKKLSLDVFISYRRADTGNVCDQIYQTLQQQSYLQGIFRDTRSILGGGDFSAVLRQAVHDCRVVLVLIGPQWLTLQDEQGRRRLDDPRDYVRWEIGEAFRAKKVVIPVLIGNARLPTSNKLPSEIAQLSECVPISVYTEFGIHLRLSELSHALHQTFSIRQNILLTQCFRLNIIWVTVATFFAVGFQQSSIGQFLTRSHVCSLLDATYHVTVCSQYFSTSTNDYVGYTTIVDPHFITTVSLIYRSLVYSGILIFFIPWIITFVYAIVQRQRNWLLQNTPWFIAGIALVIWFQILLPVALRQFFDPFNPGTVMGLLIVNNLLLLFVFFMQLPVIYLYSRGQHGLRFEAVSQIALNPS